LSAQKDLIMPLLMLVMLGMGLTLNIDDMKRTWQLKRLVLLGVGLQFLIMPLAAYLLSTLANLPTALLVGMLLVGASAGGTASNVMTYLAKGDVALSVSMTLISTLVATVALPALTWLYLGEQVDVPTGALLGSLVQLIIVPLALGMIINHFFHNKLTLITSALPAISTMSIIAIIAIVVALNSDHIQTASWLLVLLVALHNLIGLSLGYLVPRWMGYDTVISRTLAIEVAMQNSGLSVALAIKYFSAAAALPGALFSIWHNISGALFASYWHAKTAQEKHSIGGSDDRKA
jgi:BASS family bile acid:Na+ symporter